MDPDLLARSLGPLQDALKETLKKGEAERSTVAMVGSAGGGAVKVTLKGDLTISNVVIAPAAAASCAADASMLEDLVAAATNDALRQFRSRFGSSPEEQMQKMFAAGGGSSGGSSGGMASLLGPLMASLGQR